MTKIVGHRGAKGLELENTIPSFELAKKLGVDTIELDVQITKDQKFVVCHDDRLKRVNGQPFKVSQLTYAELQKLPLYNGHSVPLLKDILKKFRDTPVFVDIKINQNLPELFELLNSFKDMTLLVGSKIPEVIAYSKKVRPDLPAFYHRDYLPYGGVRMSRKHKADGLTMKYFYLTPFVYKKAQRHGIQIQVYSVNNARLARLLQKWYPGIWMVTNFPDKLIADRNKTVQKPA